MIKKTLGGVRLGSGKKMQVELHGYERSSHNTSTTIRTTMAVGTLVPILSMVALPGDTHDIDIDASGMTHPTVGPLFGSFKMQIDAFLTPIRLYQGKLHNNKLGIGRDMANVLLPQILMQASTPNSADPILDMDNSQVNPSSIFKYLGIGGIGDIQGFGTATRSFNAIPFLAYWDIYKNYYANKQEEKGAYIHNAQVPMIKTVTQIQITSGTPRTIPFYPARGSVDANRSTVIVVTFAGTRPRADQIMIRTSKGEDILLSDMMGVISGTTSTTTTYAEIQINTAELSIEYWRYIKTDEALIKEPKVEFFPLSNIDDMRESILAETKSTFPFEITEADVAPFGTSLNQVDGYFSKLIAQEGLALKTYQSDLYNNWLSTEWIDGSNGVNEISAVSTTGDKFTLDTLNLANKVYNMLNRIAVSGGSYYDWLDAVYAHDQYRRCETPMYMGGLSKEIVFQEVVSNAATNGNVDVPEQPLGTLGGKGVMGRKHKGGKVVIKVDEPSYVMLIASLTPRIDYSQGNNWDVNLKTMDDFHKPALDQIGFQDSMTEERAWWDTKINVTTGALTKYSAGKVPAWINYMTNVNRTYGNFAIAANEMFMTLNRRYEMDEGSRRIADLTTYIDPVKFNHIFAVTSRDSMNFWVQVGMEIVSRRKMSAKQIPNL